MYGSVNVALFECEYYKHTYSSFYNVIFVNFNDENEKLCVNLAEEGKCVLLQDLRAMKLGYHPLKKIT